MNKIEETSGMDSGVNGWQYPRPSEPKPDKIEWCPQHGYPLPCAKCGMPKPDKPSRLLTGNEWMDIWATGVKDEEHRRVYVNYLSGLIRQDDKTASIVREQVLKEVGELYISRAKAGFEALPKGEQGFWKGYWQCLMDRGEALKSGTMPEKE